MCVIPKDLIFKETLAVLNQGVKKKNDSTKHRGKVGNITKEEAANVPGTGGLGKAQELGGSWKLFFLEISIVPSQNQFCDICRQGECLQVRRIGGCVNALEVFIPWFLISCRIYIPFLLHFLTMAESLRIMDNLF